MLTDASTKNKSGIKLEDDLELFLRQHDISHTRAKPRQHAIDFIIRSSDKTYYIECKNQNDKGSVDEKIPHAVWKYWKKYGYDEVYIVRGDYIPHKLVYEHIETYPFKTHIMTLDEIQRILLNLPEHQGIYEYEREV